MSRGFERRGLNRIVSDTEDFTNVIRAIAGDGNAAAEKSTALSLAFNYLTNGLFNELTITMDVPFVSKLIS
jgi:hypothetical protein